MFLRKRFLIFLLFLGIYVLRYAWAWPVFDETYAGFYNGEKLIIKGWIAEDPLAYGSSVQFLLQAESFQKFDNQHPLRGTIKVTGLFVETIEYGDRVEVTGMLQVPIRKDPRIASLMKNPGLRMLEKGNRYGIVRTLLRLKHFLIDRLNELFPEPSASFAAGILLGSRSSIPQGIIDDFRKTGLTHIIALSGFNIVILISFIESLFMGFPRRLSTLLSIVIICLFTILVGASASVVRASIMGSLSLLARCFGRKSIGLRTIMITGFGMVLFDPFILFYDIGFQLSFGATAGILLFAKKWQEALQWIPNRLSLRDSIVTTWAAQVFTLPLILFYFRGFSIINTFTNIIVLPFIPWLMLGSFVSLFVGKIMAAPTFILFELVLWLIHFFASFPFAFVQVPMDFFQMV